PTNRAVHVLDGVRRRERSAERRRQFELEDHERFVETFAQALGCGVLAVVVEPAGELEQPLLRDLRAAALVRFAHLTDHVRTPSLGEMIAHVTFLVRLASWITALEPSTSMTAFRIPFPPSITHRIFRSIFMPRSMRSCMSDVLTAAFSVEPSHRPSGIFVPSLVTPSATITV